MIDRTNTKTILRRKEKKVHGTCFFLQKRENELSS